MDSPDWRWRAKKRFATRNLTNWSRMLTDESIGRDSDEPGTELVKVPTVPG